MACSAVGEQLAREFDLRNGKFGINWSARNKLFTGEGKGTNPFRFEFLRNCSDPRGTFETGTPSKRVTTCIFTR